MRRIFLAIGVLLAAGIGYVSYITWMQPAGKDEVIVRIPAGSSFDAVLDSLSNDRVISSKLAFKLYAVALRKDGKLKPGTYKFHRNTPSAELLEALVEGHSTVKVKVTFPEGTTTRKMASIVAHQLGTDSAAFVALANDRTFLRSAGINAPTAEGYLMPSTYPFFWGELPSEVLKALATTFHTFFNDSLKHLAEQENLTPYQAVILASIVEGEAKVDSERPIIAGLYLNRLHKGMKLAADPTVQYLLPDGPRRLFYKDLDIDSPYNTYKYAGLPPTPINNPGKASILAALHPDSNPYLFMVAKADGTGRHTFTTNAAAHEVAVQQYFANRDKAVGK